MRTLGRQTGSCHDHVTNYFIMLYNIVSSCMFVIKLDREGILRLDGVQIRGIGPGTETGLVYL